MTFDHNKCEQKLLSYGKVDGKLFAIQFIVTLKSKNFWLYLLLSNHKKQQFIMQI